MKERRAKVACIGLDWIGLNVVTFLPPPFAPNPNPNPSPNLNPNPKKRHLPTLQRHA